MNGKLLIFISALVLIGVYSGLRPSPSLATNCSAVGDACCGSITSILYCNPPASECDSTIHCKIPAPTTPPTTCDKVGDPCCGSYTGGFRCFNNLNCDNTIHCAACGNVGQTCCPGNTCSFGNCSSGVCVSLINPPAASSSALCGTDNLGVSTAIGCLMAGDPKQLVSQLLGWGVGVGGGIAFLMIVLAGFQMTTASGDPKKVQAARELLMSALAGLIIIALSLVLLNFIGVKILNLPGFVGNPGLNL